MLDPLLLEPLGPPIFWPIIILPDPVEDDIEHTDAVDELLEELYNKNINNSEVIKMSNFRLNLQGQTNK